MSRGMIEEAGGDQEEGRSAEKTEAAARQEAEIAGSNGTGRQKAVIHRI